MIYRMLLILVCTLSAGAMTLEAEVELNTSQLNLDYRNRLEYLQEELVNYIDQYQEWGNGDYELIIPVSLQIIVGDGRANGTRYAYTGTFSISDYCDKQYQDNKWHFELEEYETLDHQTTFHMLTSLVDFYINIIIAAQVDKLVEFGGDEWLDRAQRIVQDSKFATDTHGWPEREELILKLIDEENEPMRTLSWVYHTSLYFDEVLENDYEAWNAAVLCVDILDEIPNSVQKQRFIDFAYFKLGNLISTGKDPVFINRLQLMDQTTEHEEYYQRLLDRM